MDRVSPNLRSSNRPLPGGRANNYLRIAEDVGNRGRSDIRNSVAQSGRERDAADSAQGIGERAQGVRHRVGHLVRISNPICHSDLWTYTYVQSLHLPVYTHITKSMETNHVEIPVYRRIVSLRSKGHEVGRPQNP